MEAIHDVRQWRYGDDEPPWLPPMQSAGVELGIWLGLIAFDPSWGR
jgi:hypothetical protein